MPEQQQRHEIEIEPRFRDASGEIAAQGSDAQSRQFEVIWSTGARVMTYVRGIGPIQEELDMSPTAIRMGRFASGRAPVLDKHMGYSSRDVLGRVVSAVLVEGQGRGVIEISDDKDTETILQKIRNRVLRNVSVGYRVFQYAPVDLNAEPPIYRAVDWEPFELSTCPIGQDAGAMIRSEGAGAVSNKCVISQRAGAAHQPEGNMPQTEQTAAQSSAETQTRAAPGATQTPAAPAIAVDETAIRNAAIEGERTRAATIRDRVRSVGLADEVADDLIKRGVSIDHVGNSIVDELAKRGGRPLTPSGITIGHDNDDPQLVMRAMSNAIAARATEHLAAQQRIAVEDRAREFMQHSLLDMFADYARRRGFKIPTVGGRAAQWDAIVQCRSLSTSDFPILLADASNKILIVAYKQANNTYRMVAARKTFNDFKPHNFIRAGDFPDLLQVDETGDFKYGTMGEAKQAVTLATFGRIIKISRRIIINDDLGAFADLPMKAGRRVSDFENALGWKQIEGGNGPVIAETGQTLFHATHGNLAGAAAAIAIGPVGIGRASMMKQQSLDKLKLNVAPRYLVTSPDKFTDAESFCNVNVVAITDATANPFKGKLSPLGDANLTGNPWYLFADPSELETLIIGYLQGQEGPRFVVEEGFKSDGIEAKLAHDVAVGAIDFRGAFKNAGA